MTEVLNTTGIEPTEFNVLVELETASTTSQSGAILLPGTKIDRDQSLNIRGRLIAVSPLAFSYDTWEGVSDDKKPKLGNRVMICKGAGEYIRPEDLGLKEGPYYRLIKDKDVTAILREPTAAKKAKAA